MKTEAIIMLREIKWYLHALITTMRSSKPVPENKKSLLYRFADWHFGNYVPHDQVMNYVLYPMLVYCFVAYITTGLNTFNICAISFTTGLLTYRIAKWINDNIRMRCFWYLARL